MFFKKAYNQEFKKSWFFMFYLSIMYMTYTLVLPYYSTYYLYNELIIFELI